MHSIYSDSVDLLLCREYIHLYKPIVPHQTNYNLYGIICNCFYSFSIIVYSFIFFLQITYLILKWVYNLIKFSCLYWQFNLDLTSNNSQPQQKIELLTELLIIKVLESTYALFDFGVSWMESGIVLVYGKGLGSEIMVSDIVEKD